MVNYLSWPEKIPPIKSPSQIVRTEMTIYDTSGLKCFVLVWNSLGIFARFLDVLIELVRTAKGVAISVASTGAINKP